MIYKAPKSHKESGLGIHCRPSSIKTVKTKMHISEILVWD